MGDEHGGHGDDTSQPTGAAVSAVDESDDVPVEEHGQGTVSAAATTAASSSEAQPDAGASSASQDQGKATDEALLKRLQSLQRPTWELELLISGAVVFSLFQLPGRMRGWFEGIQPHAGPDIGMLPFMAYYFTTLLVICLAVAFSLHFVLRSVWVGLTGLRSVFPKGIEWDELDIGPIARSVYRDMNPDLRAAEQRVDRISSTIFAVLFAIVVTFGGAFLLLAVPLLLVEIVRLRFFPQVPSIVAFYAVVVLIMLPTMPVAFIDAWFKKDPDRVQKHPKLFSRVRALSTVIQQLFLARLTTPILLTLSSRFSMKKVTVGLISSIFLAVGLFLAYFALSAGVLGFDSYVFFPERGGAALLQSDHYEDQRAPDSASRLPTIQSEIIDGPFARLFVPFKAGRDGSRVQHACPQLEPRADGFFLRTRLRPDDSGENRELLLCVSSIYVVRVDGEPVEIDWAFFQHPTNELRGIVGYFSTTHLDSGRHELFVARLAEEGETTHTVLFNETAEQPAGDSEDVEPTAEAGAEGEPVSNPGTESGATTAQETDGLTVGYRDRYTILFWTPPRDDFTSTQTALSAATPGADVVAESPSPSADQEAY